MDIVERLRLFASAMKDAPTAIIDDNALRRADEIERLRNNQSIIIASFRINMMRLCPDYSPEEFDKDIAVMLKEKE